MTFFFSICMLNSFHLCISNNFVLAFTWLHTNSQVFFFSTPGIGYDISKNEGIPFKYFTYGAACSEVEIDCLTGDHQVTLQLSRFINLFKLYLMRF